MSRTEPTFFTKPIRWNAGVKRGFIVRPNTNGVGWGDPFEDEAGNPVFPGTEGGPYDRAFLGIKNGAWKVIRRESLQEAGNIDWKGEWTSQSADKRRIVTWNGPQQRYWNSGSYQYDAAVEKQRYIYSNGGIIGIAPAPVLGAAFRTYDRLQQDGSTATEKWVIAVCVSEGRDVVFLTQQYLNLRQEDVTEQAFLNASRVVDTDSTIGWVQVGTSDGYTGEGATVPAEAPWFFDTKGEYARTMRRCVYSHSEHASSGTMDDTLHREIRLSVDIELLSAKFSLVEDFEVSLNNSTWFTKVETHREQRTFTQPAGGSSYDPGPPIVYESAPSLDGFDHEFLEDGVRTEVTYIGSSKMCVDYDPDRGEWVYGWIAGSLVRNHNQYWTEGIDEANTQQEEDDGREPNTGLNTGPQPKPSGYTIAEWNHYESQWAGMDTQLDFIVTPAASVGNLISSPEYQRTTLIWDQSGTASVQAGGERDPDDPFFAFWDHYVTWLHFVDIRSGLIAGYLYLNLYSVPNGGLVITEEVEWGGVSGDPLDLPQLEGDVSDSHFFMRYQPLPPRYFNFPTFWDRTLDMKTWATPVEEVHSYKNYSATLPVENSDESLWVPNWQSAYKYTPWATEYPKPRWEPISLIEMLYTPEFCDITGIFGSTELKEHMVHLEYFDKNEKAFIAKTHSWNVTGDPLTAVAGGDKLYPGGLK